MVIMNPLYGNNKQLSVSLLSPKSVLPKVGCRRPLNHTKSDTIALTKCIFDQLQLGKKRKTSMKVPKQKFGKHCRKCTPCLQSQAKEKCHIFLLIAYPRGLEQNDMHIIIINLNS